MALSHNNLQTYYATNFNLVQHHKYSINEVENLIPFERDIYVEMLVDYIRKKEEEKKRKQ